MTCPDCGTEMKLIEVNKTREEYHCKNPKCKCKGGCKTVRFKGDENG